MAGFIHDKLDIKLLALYLADRLFAPVDFNTYTDLALCDDGVNYFQFAEAVAELKDSGHIVQSGELYSITEKGRRACSAGESSLSPVIRQRCDRRLAPLNRELKHKAQVRAQVRETPQGFDVCLALDDDVGSLFSLVLHCPTQADARQVQDGFLDHPDRVYGALLDILLAKDNGSDKT